MVTCFPAWSGFQGVHAFCIDATLDNLDGFEPAWATFTVPSTLPRDGVSYWPHFDLSTRTYWALTDPNKPISYQHSDVEEPRVISNDSSNKTLCDPAITGHGDVLEKAPHYEPVTHEMKIAPVPPLQVPPVGNSIDAVLNDPAILAISSKFTKADGFKKLPTSYINASGVSRCHNALDLAKQECPKVFISGLDRLDLALDEIQKGDLPQRLRNVDLGRLATVAETVAEAYAENATTNVRDSDATKAPTVQEPSQTLALMNPLQILDEHLFEDDSTAKSPTISLPKQKDDSRRPSTGNSSMSSVEPEMIEAISRDTFDITHSYFNAEAEAGEPIQYIKGGTSPTSPGVTEQGGESRRPSTDGPSKASTELELSKKALQDTVTNGHAYPQPWLLIEKPFVTKKDGISDQDQSIKAPISRPEADVAVALQVPEEAASTTPENVKTQQNSLSKSQKKRMRIGKKKRAQAAANSLNYQQQIAPQPTGPQIAEDKKDQAPPPVLLNDLAMSSSAADPNTQHGLSDLVSADAIATEAAGTEHLADVDVMPNEPDRTSPVYVPTAPTQAMGTMDTSSEGVTTADLDLALGKLPDNWGDSEEDEPVSCTKGLTGTNVRKVLEESDRKGNFGHSNMHFAMQHLRPPGFVQVRILQEADRSLAWFRKFFNSDRPRAASIIEAGKAEDLAGSADSVLVLSTQTKAMVNPEPPFHHLNFLFQKVYTKSATPPEVSLWAAVSCHRLYERLGVPRACSKKAVLISQAWRYVDPYSFSGPDELLELEGTKLREAVVGYAEKVYEPCGIWDNDWYDEDENIPKSLYQVQEWYNTSGENFYNAVLPYYMDAGDDVVIARNGPCVPSARLELDRESPLRLSQLVDDADKAETIRASSGAAKASSTIECISVGEYHQSDEEIDADNLDFYGNTSGAVNVQDGEPISLDAGDVEPSAISDHGDSQEDSDALADLRKLEWLAEYSDSPDRIRNLRMNTTDTPAMFRQRTVVEVDEAFSEASTDLESEYDLSAEVNDYNDGNQMPDPPSSGVAAILPDTDVEFEYSSDVGLETVPEEEAEESGTDDSVTPCGVLFEEVRTALEVQNRNKLIALQAEEDHEPTSAALNSNASSTGSAEIDAHPVSDVDTPVTPLSPAFSTVLKETSTEPIPVESQIGSAAESAESPCANSSEIPCEDSSPVAEDNDLSAPMDEQPQESTTKDDTKQVVLYEPRPRWFNILMVFARTLKHATTMLHKSKSVEPAAHGAATPQNVKVDIPEDVDLMSHRPDFNECHFGTSTIYVGKQGIKVAKAAVQVGMMPVHAGVEVAKTPFKAAKTTWKIGNWAWSRFVRRR